MKIGDKVWIKHPNPFYSERWNEWQIWEIVDIRKQASGDIFKLKGLCIKDTYSIGLGIGDVELVRRSNVSGQVLYVLCVW